MAVVTPSNDAVQTLLVNFLTQLFPTGVEIVEGLDNLVPEPVSDNFILLTPRSLGRLAFNIDSFVDVAFTGSISGQVLTVATVSIGTLAPPATLFGTGVAPRTQVMQQLTGSAGGSGTYAVNVAQELPSQQLAAGTKQMLEKTEVVYQLDVHAASNGTGADMAQIITVAFRDAYAYDFFDPQVSGVAPLWASDPRLTPFRNDQNQTEWRWVVDVHMQVNAAIVVGQQFAQAIVVGLIDVDAAYPP